MSRAVTVVRLASLTATTTLSVPPRPRRVFRHVSTRRHYRRRLQCRTRRVSPSKTRTSQLTILADRIKQFLSQFATKDLVDGMADIGLQDGDDAPRSKVLKYMQQLVRPQNITPSYPLILAIAKDCEPRAGNAGH